MEPMKRKCGAAMTRLLSVLGHCMLRLWTWSVTEVFPAGQSHWRYVPSGSSDVAAWATVSIPSLQTIYMGHLRYCITGKSGLSFAPLSRRADALRGLRRMQDRALTDYYESIYTKRQ